VVKIFLAEDDKSVSRIVTINLEESGHEISVTASSLSDALAKIEEAKDKGVKVAVLDGNLGTGPGDGPQIANLLRQAIPEIKIVSFSGDPVTWGDFNPMKPKDISNLGNIVTKAVLDIKYIIQ